MKRKPFVLLLALAALTYLYSCTKDKTATAVTVNCTGVDSALNTFTLNISPNILQTYCDGGTCHFGANGGGVDFSTYQSTVSAFKNSTVICAITNAGCELMPKGVGSRPSTPLPDSLIQQMKCWQANGYPQ